MEEYITSNAPDMGVLLADVESLKVSETGGKTNITFRVYSDFCIPYVAQEVVPVALEALKENEATLGRIQVWYYQENNKEGILSDSIVSWDSKDGEKGTFASAPDGITKTGYTIENLLDYYKDYKELAEKLRSGEEASHE